jgi:hypothetical protein
MLKTSINTIPPKDTKTNLTENTMWKLNTRIIELIRAIDYTWIPYCYIKYLVSLLQIQPAAKSVGPAAISPT